MVFDASSDRTQGKHEIASGTKGGDPPVFVAKETPCILSTILEEGNGCAGSMEAAPFVTSSLGSQALVSGLSGSPHILESADHDSLAFLD